MAFAHGSDRSKLISSGADRLYGGDPRCPSRILLREVTDRNTFCLTVDADFEAPVLLAFNADTDIRAENNGLTVTLSEPRAYAWLHLKRKA